MHVPKAAGTSVRRVLIEAGIVDGSDRYHDPYLSNYPDVRHRGADWDMNVIDVQEVESILTSRGVAMGHLCVRTFLDAHVDRCWLLVREPRSRLLSRYDHFLRDPSGVEIIDAGPEPTLTDFLDAPWFSVEVDNLEARMILPSLAPHDAVAMDDADAFRAAVRAEVRSMGRGLAGAVWSEGDPVAMRRLLADVSPDASTIDERVIRRDNVTPPGSRDLVLSDRDTAALQRSTWRSTIVLQELIEAGLLAGRDDSSLEAEFVRTAVAHGFRVD